MRDTQDRNRLPERPGDPAASREEGAALRSRIAALYSTLANLYGADRLVLKAGKLEALPLLRSEDLVAQVLGLQRLIIEDPTLDKPPAPDQLSVVLAALEDEVTSRAARRSLEDELERRIADRLQARHEDYLQEIKVQVLKEDAGPENAQTLKRLAVLEKLDRKKLARSALEILRPATLDDVVGQERAMRALLAKVASPYPQHVLLYGPPGVGKTTVARLVLQEAKKRKRGAFAKDAPFVEVDGATLRWDPRDVTNPLLGSVHDPIYQGARRDLAEGGVPEPKLGLVTEAHGGILFIDELGEMDPMLHNKLLKVMEDRRVNFDSSYYDPADPAVPKYIRRLFEQGAPADFLLIGATTRDASEINPAFRSRCAEVYFDPLTQADIARIVLQAATRLQVTLEPGVAELIGQYTLEGRKAAGILADAYSLALFDAGTSPEAPLSVNRARVVEVIQTSRLSPYVTQRAATRAEVGRVFGLGVQGYVGSVLEVEAMAFSAREPGKGSLRFNDTAGSMTRDSLFNAAAVVRSLTGEDLSNWDLHVNVVGGARIDGPSAGLALVLVMISAITGRPLRQDIAFTGEVSVRGVVKAVGGIPEKIFGAQQAGMSRVILPAENRADVPAGLRGLEVQPVTTVGEALQAALETAAASADAAR